MSLSVLLVWYWSAWYWI